MKEFAHLVFVVHLHNYRESVGAAVGEPRDDEGRALALGGAALGRARHEEAVLRLGETAPVAVLEEHRHRSVAGLLKGA